jgi:hypothetical protein
MTRKTPVNVAASVRARLLKVSKERREDFTLTLMNYAAERFLYRLSRSTYREKPDTTPAAPLSGEFLGGGTTAGLDKIRARLLDLTNRNRLLNFRHTSASSIRIVDGDPNIVFARLLNGEEMSLRPVPEPPSDDPETDGCAGSGRSRGCSCAKICATV